MTRLLLGLLLGLFTAGYRLVLGWYPDVAWLHQPMVSLWLPLVVLLACLYVILFAHTFRPADPALAAWTACATAGCLLLVPLILAKQEQEGIDRAMEEEVARLAEQARLQRLREEAERRELAADDDTGRDRYSRYEGRLPAATLAILRDLDQRMQATVKEAADSYQAALAEYPTRGPNEWLVAPSLAFLQAEREAHLRLYEAARQYTQVVEGFEDLYAQELHGLELQPPADRVAIAEMERLLQELDRLDLLTLRKLDLEVLSAALEALDVLIQAWDQWSYNPGKDALSFDDPALERAFASAILRLQDASKAVDDLLQPPENP